MCEIFLNIKENNGEMSELAKGHAWKACKAVKAPRVRVPLSPPFNFAVLNGAVAEPCNLQSAVAGLMPV